MVQQQPHLDPALDGRDEGGKEDVGGVVPGHDVVLDMAEVLGLVDGGGHGLVQAFGRVVGAQVLPRDTRQPRQPMVHGDQAVQCGAGAGG